MHAEDKSGSGSRERLIDPQESNSVNSFSVGGSLLGLKLLHQEIQSGRENI